MARVSEPPPRRAAAPPKFNQFLDLNTDFGQTADRHFFTGKERTLLHYVSSVNIPCCVHDGDPAQVLQDIQTARQNDCVVGAHIAYPDPKHFGYNVMDLDETELEAWILLQLGAFSALCRASKVDFDHVRPHGALYEQMIQNEQVAATVARAVRRFDQWMILVAPISPVWERLQVDIGLQVAQEVYLGKRINANGMLVLDQLNENLHPQGVIEQVRQLASHSTLTTQDGETVKVSCKTMHLSPKLQGNMMIAERINAMLGKPVGLALSAAGSSGWA